MAIIQCLNYLSNLSVISIYNIMHPEIGDSGCRGSIHLHKSVWHNACPVHFMIKMGWNLISTWKLVNNRLNWPAWHWTTDIDACGRICFLAISLLSTRLLQCLRGNRCLAGSWRTKESRRVHSSTNAGHPTPNLTNRHPKEDRSEGFCTKMWFSSIFLNFLCSSFENNINSI